MPESIKSQIEEYLEERQESLEADDPELTAVIDSNSAHLLELADKADKDDPEALRELYAILERIDQVATEAHERVKVILNKRNETQPNKPNPDFASETPEIAELLQKLETSYDEMADTLDNYGYEDKIPDKNIVMAAIKKLGPEMLEKIGKFGKPTVLITTAGTLRSKTEKLDGNKKYAKQDNTNFGEPPEDELWGPAPAKLKVTIVDGAAEMPQLPEEIVKQDWEARHKWLTAEYKKEGMEMITAYEYAMLAQKSLRSYELATEEIIDQATYTALNCEHLTEMGKVPTADWNSDFRRFNFDWNFPDDQDPFLSSRPSVQVLEYDEAAEKVEHVLTSEQKEELFETLKARFEANMQRHSLFEWMPLYDKLNFENVAPEKLWALNEMERTGGEPDVVGFDELTGEYIFIDCSAESPEGRRNCVYDREAEEKMKKGGGICSGNAVDMAATMGIELLTEEEYRELNMLGEFDKNTWTWLNTPFDIRKTDSALYGFRTDVEVSVLPDRAAAFGDNGAFRGALRI